MSGGSLAVMALSNQHFSIPVAIPTSTFKRNINSKQKPNENEINAFDNRLAKKPETYRPAETESTHESGEEEEFRLPDGSPTFSAVMNEMSSTLSKTSVRDHVKIPVFPNMTPADAITTHPIDNTFTKHVSYALDHNTPGSNSPLSTDSPATPRKGVVPRGRSYSWNHRNKIVVERRKALSVSFHPDAISNSNHSSPTMQRKKKTKPRPATSLPASIHPKYKILTENLAVSHEDLVKEQERERHLADGFAEVKSIFQSRYFDRLGISPENVS